ncbi:hypothetical protein MBLNU459_g1377t1 [Dothideomycetes sp. NU459]
MAPNNKSSLKDVASRNPSQLGDPVSLKAETSNTTPTDNDRPNKAGSSRGGGQGGEHKTLKQVAQETNPSQLGDPISLKAETSDSEPTDQDRPVKTAGKSKL